MFVPGPSTEHFKGKESSQHGEEKRGKIISSRSGDKRRASKSAKCSLFLPTRWTPPHRGKCARAPGAQSWQEASPCACAPPALAPRPCPPCRPRSRSPLRRLPPRGPQAICYIKQNSHHTHVPAAPQRWTPREASSPSPPPATAARPVCPATRSGVGLALATPSPSPIAALVKKTSLRLPPP